MVKEIVPNYLLSFLLLPFLLMLGCQEARQTTLSQWLQPDSPTVVNFPLTAALQTYSFSANAASSTQLSLYPVTPNLSYTAEVRDNMGSVIATLGSGLQNVVLTIAPGQGLYEVAVKSDRATDAGMLSMLVTTGANGALPSNVVLNPIAQSAATPVFKTAAFTNPYNPLTCTARGSAVLNVNIRSGPGLGNAVIGTLASGSSITVLGRSDNDWVQVNLSGQIGWISGSVVVLDGACEALPDVTPPIPTPVPTTVPIEPNAFHLDVDRDGWGDFSENVAYSDGPKQDLIQLSVGGLSSGTPDNYREFTLTLVCSGSQTSSLRWGAPDRPSLQCGQSTVMPFTATYSRQMIGVALYDTTGQATVAYTLLASKH